MAISKVQFKSSASATPVVWMDATSATAGASNIISPYTAMLANGVVTQGTGSGGGGSGLVYESGTWTPASDTDTASISFSGTYSNAPFYVLITDTNGTYYDTNYSMFEWTLFDFNKCFGSPIYYSSTSAYYAFSYSRYRGTSSTSLSGSANTHTSATNNKVNESGFSAGYSNSYYWRAARTYKWIAVWAPTT